MFESPFADFRDEALAAVDEVFAEPVKLSFLKAGAVDPDRAAVTISAPVKDGAEISQNVSGGDRAQWNSRVSAAIRTLNINAATYAGPPIRRGDKVKLLARAGEPWFAVTSVDDRSKTRIIVTLGEA